MNHFYSFCAATVLFSVGATLCIPVNAATINVGNAKALQAALDNVHPGDVIKLSPGVYSGEFVATRSGAKGKPITLSGPTSAVLKNASGYGFDLQGNYWVLSGFTVSDSGKGIVLDGASHNLLTNLTVKNIGAEGVHFRAITENRKTRFSSNNVLQFSIVRDTGKAPGDAGFGEGVYIGSATNHWSDRSNNKPDTSDNNCVANNIIGPNVAAEGIDVKEGTTGALIVGNTYYASGISGANNADSFIDVKGNNTLVYGNTVDNSASKTRVLRDGFQTHERYNGFGSHNIFQKNTVMLYSSGHGVDIDSATTGNKVCEDNVVHNAASGVANVNTVSCPKIATPKCADVIN